MAFGNHLEIGRVHHTKPSTLGWSVVVGLYKLNDTTISGQPQPEKKCTCIAVCKLVVRVYSAWCMVWYGLK